MTDKATLEEIEALVAGCTPSPWVIRDDGQSYAMPIIDSPNVGKGYFASIGQATQRDPNPVHGGGISIQTATANGHLMAHAPRLLEICREQAAREARLVELCVELRRAARNYLEDPRGGEDDRSNASQLGLAMEYLDAENLLTGG